MKCPLKIKVSLKFQLAIAGDTERGLLKLIRVGVTVAGLLAHVLIALHVHHVI